MGLPLSNPFLAPATPSAGPAVNPFEVATTVPHLSPFAAPPVGEADEGIDVVVELEPAAPSTQALLERAARLGPARPTLESIALPDPILDEKRKPRVAQRRARFTRFVKATLGACLGLCVLALGASALSGEEPTASAATPSSMGRTSPAQRVPSLEALAGASRAKATAATPHRSPSVAKAATAKPRKAKGKKRR